MFYHKGRAFIRLLRRHGFSAAAQRLLGKKSPIAMHIETPLEGGYTLGGVYVRGWAFSTFGEIVRVEVVEHGKVIGTLRSNLPRPDVSDHFGNREALYSGFEGVVRLEGGRRRIAVRVTDALGNRFETRLRLLTERNPPPEIAIESASWFGSSLSVKGWALWVGSGQPRIAHYYVDDTLVGISRCNLSRPDISGRYAPEFALDCRGFKFDVAIANSDSSAMLRVEITERTGRKLIAVRRIRREQALARHSQSFLDTLALVRTEVTSDPSVLDWDADLQLHQPLAAIFSPPLESEKLPYFDESIDIVVIADGKRRDEARRIARLAVVTVGEQDDVEWKSGAAPRLPSVSIIVPVYDRWSDTCACLQQLRESLPHYFTGEIIVSDDASTDETLERLTEMASDWPLLRVLHADTNGGFIAACNRAAKAASGEFLVFLNNDTLPQDGWLEALLSTFRLYPEAGAVGGKLINPDFTLQEAGGTVTADALTAHFGAEDPSTNAPLYHHVREVDYCSGALLMTPRALFERIGGFDTRYAPAYFEDVDYCFAVRAHGLKVFYQPDSTAFHAAHGSYKDAAARIDSNRRIFLEKWASTLVHRPKVASSRDPDILQRRRVLFYGNRMPEFDRFGGLLRLSYLITALAESGWAVTFYARDITGAERYVDLLRQRGIMVYGGDLSLGIDDSFMPDPVPLISASRFDLAVLSLWQTAEPIIPLLREHAPATPIIVDSSDVHFVREARALVAEHKTLDVVFGRSLVGELNTYAKADTVLTVSEKEAEIVDTLLGRTHHAYAVPNMMKTTPTLYAFSERHGIVFTGSYGYPPNVEAVEYLIQQVIPLLPPNLLIEHPLYLIGDGAHRALASLVRGIEGVRLVGWVPDVTPYLQRSRIAVVPLLNGAGTKTKLITALANRTPVVSTWIGAEGLDIEHERHALIADHPADFAAAIERLLTEETLWVRLADSGFRHIEATHGYEAGKRRFLDVINIVLGRLGSGSNNPTPVRRSSINRA